MGRDYISSLFSEPSFDSNCMGLGIRQIWQKASYIDCHDLHNVYESSLRLLSKLDMGYCSSVVGVSVFRFRFPPSNGILGLEACLGIFPSLDMA